MGPKASVRPHRCPVEARHSRATDGVGSTPTVEDGVGDHAPSSLRKIDLGTWDVVLLRRDRRPRHVQIADGVRETGKGTQRSRFLNNDHSPVGALAETDAVPNSDMSRPP